MGLGLLAMLLFLIGCREGWDATFGLILNGLASAADVGIWKIKLPGGAGFRKLDSFVQKKIGEAILATEQSLGLWWHANTQVVEYLADSWLDFTWTMHDFGSSLVHGTIPATVDARTKPGIAHARREAHSAAARAGSEARARARGDKAIAADLDTTFGRARAGIDSVGEKSKAYTDARVGRVQGQIAAERAYSHRVLNKRLTWLEKALGVGALGGIAIAALTRVFPYWQCSSFRRFSRLICRAPLGALDDLFGLALLAVGPISIVEFARMLQGVTEEVDDAVRFFVR